MKHLHKAIDFLSGLAFFTAFAIILVAPAQAQGKKVTALLLPPVTYTAAQALTDTAFFITDLADQERSFQEMMTFIRDAAGSLHLTCITLRASNGVINRQSPEWIEIRDALRGAGYSVETNNRTQQAEICW